MGYVQFEKRPQKCVETGSVHFWYNFLGTKKTYKVDIQLLVDYSERRGRDWLLRSRWSLRLTPFPYARRKGPSKPTAQKAASRSLCFSHLCLQVNLRQRYKNKRYRFLDTFLLRNLAEREGFEPPEPRSSTVFKTAAIDHSATSPKDKSTPFFLIHQIFFKIFSKYFRALILCCDISITYTKLKLGFFNWGVAQKLC